MEALQITDVSNAQIEHSVIINNFVRVVGSTMKHSICKVFGEGIQFQWEESGKTQGRFFCPREDTLFDRASIN